MKFEVDDDNTVRIDGTPAENCEVLDDILNLQGKGITIVEKPVVFTEADPLTGTPASLFQQTQITYGDTIFHVLDTGTREELHLEEVEDAFDNGNPRRLIVSYQPVAGYLVAEGVPAAIESSFTRGAFISIPPFD